MPNIPKHVKEHQEELFLKTNKPFRIVPNLDAARLIDPKQHPYRHKNRLCRRITDALAGDFDDIHRLIGMLPESYRRELLRHPLIRSIRLYTLMDLAHSRSKEPKAENIEYYRNLMDESLEAITGVVPAFGPSLNRHLGPFLELLNDISNFAKEYHLESKVPIYPKSNSEKETG